MNAPNRRETYGGSASSHSRKSRARSAVKYCRECGAEVYTNEKKCWNCGSKTTDRKVQCIIAWVLCVIFALGCVGGDSSSTGTSTSSKESEENASTEVIGVKSSELAYLYDKDEVTYSTDYKGKTVRTTGTVRSKKVDPWDESRWIVVMETTYDNFLSNTIDCVIATDSKEKLSSYGEGDTITVQGVVEDGFMSAELEDCIIIE